MDYDDNTTPGLEAPEDLGQNPQAVVRRWLLELKLADKREKDWRKTAQECIDLYKGAIAKKNSFNILWSNTETLLPAVYSSVPKPDVRRRYKDADPLGKAVSEIISRALDFSMDTYDFDGIARSDVMDMLLVGRGVSRVRYVPNLVQVGADPASPHDEEQEALEDPEHESLEGDHEEVEWEQTVAEHVQWDDFRMGPGKRWEELAWVGFRHRLTRDELVRQFGDVGIDVKLDSTGDDDVNKLPDHESEPFKTAEVWEIWDKDGKEVLFISASYKTAPLKQVSDPLELKGFFPCPRPIYAVEDIESLIPIPLYSQYKEQAEELNRISTRINKIVDALKVRGVYDSSITELAEVMRGSDNDLIPAQNVTALLERGGLEKAIWMLPVEQLVNVLASLYKQRDAVKQTIYEITGMSDILRGASNPNETATAQQIKSQWGSLRVKRMQQDISRYLRDILRLKAEIISQKFEQATLAQMTLVQLPTMQEVQMQAMQQGQQFKPPVTWEDVMQVLRSDLSRTYRVDVETDSTIAASMEADMQGMRDVITGVVQFVQGVGPAVQSGAMPIEAVKEIIMSVVRRARMGSAVEDALEKMQAPQQQQGGVDPKQYQQEKQQAQQKIQELTQQLQQAQQKVNDQQSKAQQELQSQNMEHQSEAMLLRMEQQHEAVMVQQKLAFDRWQEELIAQTKVIVANIAAQNKADIAAEQREQKAEEPND